MQKVYEALQRGEDIRNHLIELKKMLKEEGALDTYLSMTEDDELIASFLQDEDAKTRKNAAVILGQLQSQESIDKLWDAYVAETQLFVKSAYLSAMQKLNCKAYEKQLKERYQKLLAYEPAQEEIKHIQEEIKELRRIVIQFEGGIAKHTFTGYAKPQNFILTTVKNFQDTTGVQLEHGKLKIIPMGIQVVGGDIRETMRIRTFREVLFTLRCRKNLPSNPSVIAKELAQSDLTRVLSELHEGEPPFYFRIELKGTMPLEKKSAFVKKIAAELEQRTRHFLVNSTENYEVEVRLIENRTGGFYPCLKLYTLPMKRFSYRKYTMASSMHPSMAALLVELASSWLTEHALIMDAFCGTGTLLMERIYALSVRAAFGTDTFGEAIQGARENAAIAHLNINFIHRDFMDFTNSCPLDEIWADMPLRGKKEKEEHDAFYQAFFDKAKSLLKEHGRIFVYSNENAFVKKYLRLHEDLRLKQEVCIREKAGVYFFIIEKCMAEKERPQGGTAVAEDAACPGKGNDVPREETADGPSKIGL